MSKLSSEPEAASSPRNASAQGGRATSGPAAQAGGPVRSKKLPSASAVGRDAPPSAQRRAAVILEVLAGEQTAAEAARLLGISVMHYYLLERKALQGLVAACAPRPVGPRGPQPEQELIRLRRELAQSRRECQRQAALVRATQRAVGLPAAAPPKAQEKPGASGGKRSRRRRATVRALRAAQRLRQNSSGPETADLVERPPAEGNGLLGAGLSTPPAGSDKGRTVTQEAGHGAPGQEAVRHGSCGASVGIGAGQAAADDAPGDAAG